MPSRDTCSGAPSVVTRMSLTSTSAPVVHPSGTRRIWLPLTSPIAMVVRVSVSHVTPPMSSKPSCRATVIA